MHYNMSIKSSIIVSIMRYLHLYLITDNILNSINDALNIMKTL